MAAEIIRGKVCRKLYNEGSGWHHLNPQIKHNGTKCRTTTHYEVLMGWHKQHPVLHMKWKKKLKLKLDLLIYRGKKKGNRLKDTTGSSWPNPKFRMSYRTNLWVSVIKPEAWRKREGGKDCYKRRKTWRTVFIFWFKQDQVQEDVFGKLRKGQCKLGIIYRCYSKEASSICLSRSFSTFFHPALSLKGWQGMGYGSWVRWTWK